MPPCMPVTRVGFFSDSPSNLLTAPNQAVWDLGNVPFAAQACRSQWRAEKCIALLHGATSCRIWPRRWCRGTREAGLPVDAALDWERGTLALCKNHCIKAVFAAPCRSPFQNVSWALVLSAKSRVSLNFYSAINNTCQYVPFQ